MSNTKPNILVIMSDQHSPDIIGCHGDSRVHTPHLDRLAAEGVRFERAYCSNPMCVPSRMSCLTGKTSNQLEVWSLSDTIRSDELTWPVALGAAGYETVGAGHVHLWWPDKHVGFHHRPAMHETTRVCTGTFEIYEPGERRDQQLERFGEVFLHELKPGQTGHGKQHGVDHDLATTAAAEAFLHARPDGADPFALYVGYHSPHSPLRCPSPWYDRYRDMPVEPEELDPTLPPVLQRFAAAGRFDCGMDRQTYVEAVRAYYALVSFVDDQVGRLIEALRVTGQLENTVIIYTADHGEMMGRRGLWFKNQLLEPAIRIPMMFRWPARFGQGVVEHRLASLLDMFPTLLDLGGAEPWPEAVGDSLVPLLEGCEAVTLDDRAVFVEYADYGAGQPAAVIRRGNMKLLAARTYADVLYDLAADPGETTDVSRDPRYAGDLDQLRRDLSWYWEPEDTYRRVLRNQSRIERHRKSKILHAIRTTGSGQI